MRSDAKAISIAMAIKSANKLESLAKREERSLSSYVRLLLFNHIKEVEKEDGIIEVDVEKPSIGILEEVPKKKEDIRAKKTLVRKRKSA